MTKEKNPNDEPVRLVDENDRSLTFLNTHVDGFEDENDSLLDDESDDLLDDEASYNEEFAAEYAPAMGAQQELDIEEDDEGEHVSTGKGVGTFALVLSILSLLFLPILLGIAGIIVGFVSRHYQAKVLGNWAIGIGVLSIIVTVFFSPFI